MGSLFKSKTTTTKQPFETNPWEPQQEYLLGGFEQAQTALQKALGIANDDSVADLTQRQKNQINNGIGLGNQAQTAGQNLMQQGSNLTNNLNRASNNLQNTSGAIKDLASTGNQYAGQIAGAGQQAQTVGNNLAQAGQQANSAAQTAGGTLTQMGQGNAQAGIAGGQQVSQGAQGIGQLSSDYAASIGSSLDQSKGASQGVLSQAQGMVGNGGVGGIINDAQQVANNPYLQSQIDSAIGDVNRGFQQTQADINSAASGAGAMNSTRAGLVESRALESAQRTAADISSGMRSDAYNTGLNTALNNKQVNNSLLGTQLNAGAQQMGINDQKIALSGQDLSTQLNANNQLATGNNMQQQARNDGFSQVAQGLGTQLNGYESLMAGLQGQMQGANTAGSLYGSAGQTALAGQGASVDARLQKAQQQQSLGALGASMTDAGYQLGASGNANAFDLASVIQNQRQNEINGKMQNPMDLISQYMQAIGGNYGSNGYQSTTTKSASPFQQIVGGAATIAGAIG